MLSGGFSTHQVLSALPQAGEEAVKDVLALAKDETILPFVAIALGFLNGWDETKGIYFGVCQTFSVSTGQSVALLAQLMWPLP